MTPHLEASPPPYVPRDPSQTALYHVVADHLETCLASLDAEPDPSGQQISLPISCTTLAEEDPYIHFSEGKGLFRVPDLLELVALLSVLKSQHEAT